MRTPLRLLAFGAVLVVVFALSLVAARSLRPAEAGSAAVPAGPGAGPSASGADGMDHGGTTPSPSAEQHGGEESSAPNPVRGLSVAAEGYQLEALTAPARTRKQGALSFRLTGPDGGPVTGYTVSHDKELHLVVVRSDGSEFRHVHPTHDGAGGWSLPWRWTAAGSYRVFADFVPAATGEPLTLTGTVDVAGDLAPTPAGPDTDTATVDGYTVGIAGRLRAGQESTLTFTVTRGGAAVTTLQPYLGAAGHLVALRDGDLAYLHVHPMDEEPAAASGPDVAFMVQPPSPGRYLLYLASRSTGRSTPPPSPSPPAAEPVDDPTT